MNKTADAHAYPPKASPRPAGACNGTVQRLAVALPQSGQRLSGRAPSAP